MAFIQERPGMSFDHVFNTIKLMEVDKHSFAVARDHFGASILSGLMRGAVIKANGPEVVKALNITFARGWAAAHGSLPIGDGMKQLIWEVIELTESQAEHTARILCEKLNVDFDTPMNEDSEVIAPFATYYLREAHGFDEVLTETLDGGIL